VGPGGLGEVVMAGTDNQLSYRRWGLALGKGGPRETALASIDQVVEGVQTAGEVHELATRVGVEMPITEQVYAVLYEAKSPKQAVHALLHREQKAEQA